MIVGCFGSNANSPRSKVDLYPFMNEKIIQNDMEVMYLTILRLSIEMQDDFFIRMWIDNVEERREAFSNELKGLSISELKERKYILDLYIKTDNYIAGVKNNKPILYGYENKDQKKIDEVRSDIMVDYYITLHNQLLLVSVGKDGFFGTQSISFTKSDKNKVKDEINDYLLEQDDFIFIANKYLGNNLWESVSAYKKRKSEIENNIFLYQLDLMYGIKGASYLTAFLGEDIANQLMQNTKPEDQGKQPYSYAETRKERYSYVKRDLKSYNFITQ